MTYWKNQHFKALQAAWYERLKDIGFTDLEKLVGDEMRMINESPICQSRAIKKVLEQAPEYYAVISHNVSNFSFKNAVDELILTRHAEGRKIKAICEELECRGEPRCRSTIRFIVRKYEVLWGIRKYSPKQLNKKTA